MLNPNVLPELLTVFLLNIHMHIVDSQEPCSSPGSKIAGTVYESTFSSFDPNSTLYRTDTTIEGINQGAQTASGVNITFLRTQATPADLKLNNLFELITLPVSNSTFGSRTFIQLKSAIDRDGSSYTENDDLNNIEFQLSCRALKYPTQTKFFVMQLEIRDINDNAPIFTNASYSASILESAPMGTIVYSGVIATDLDAGINKEIEYTIAQGNESLPMQYFDIEKKSGKVFLKQGLCATTSSQFQFSVIAKDNGSPPLTGESMVTIQIIRNSQPPVFLNTPYRSAITRAVQDNSALPGVSVATTDADTVSPFNVVSVTVIGDDSAVSLFRLDGSNIRVQNAANLAADTANTYKLRLLAEDGGSSKKTATATVDITVNRNLAAPQFIPASYTQTIIENFPVGSEIVTVTAIDSDPQAPNNQFKFSIVPGTNADTYFYINPDSGRISLKQSIKGTGVQQFIFRVAATDEGTPSQSGQATVTVDVTIDETLRFTKLQPYTASIDENDPVDRSFITVTATPQPNIKYSIVGYSDSPDYFKIDENTGAISVKTDLRTDLSKRTTYLILVRAEKQFPNGLQSAENTVNVTVARNINPPVFNSTVYRASIDEKYNLGRSVVQVFATDADTQDVLLYSIIDQTGETEPFYMAVSTGVITLRQLLAGTSKTTYTFTVRVRDQSKPEKSALAQVEITVRRNTSPPAFLRQQYGTGIDYNQALGPVISTSAVDPDLSGTLIYEVIGYMSAPGYFSVNANGQVSLIASLASDTAITYTLGLTAYDSDYPNDKAYANVTISVNRNPNAPSFTSPSYSRTINESYPLAVSLVQISGQDADQHAIEYILESSNPVEGTNFFYLNPATGLLTVSRPLTETSTQIFTLQVRLRDNGIPPKSSAVSAPVTITITRNDNAPIFAGPFTTIIPETRPISTGVLTVTATDGDSNLSPYGQLRYKLIGDGDFQQFFNIDTNTGNITVRRPLTSQGVASYQGRIVAEDGGSPPRSATAIATINIQRNLNHPVFTQTDYSISIYETQQVGQNVITVTATDADQIRPNNEINYEMTDTTPNLNGAGLNFFSIRSENNRGVISIVLPLYTDNQDTPVYTFSVRARDNGSPTQFSVDQATVRITVYRNLFPPIFQGTPYTATLNFNSVSGITVKQVKAKDADAQSPHNVVTYSIIGDATAQTLLSINAASGLITTRQSLLNNNVETSSILIEARDGGTPSLSATSTVSVTISRNLNPPEWVNTSYTVNITEIQDLGVTITNMNTRDADTALPYNTRITTLTGDADMLQFFRLTADGRLSVQRPLTLSTRRSFTGTVSLQDGGNPPLTPTGVKTATITVYVSRNDHTPYFINDPYSKDLEGNIQTGASVLQVTARDNDQGPFGIVRYRVTGDDLAPTYFQVDPTSGLITVRNVLSGVNQDQFKVRIEAYDQGSPSKTNVTVVTLTVKSNYQRPIFNRLSYVARIPETQSLGQQIIAVTANDTDALTPNNVVRYSLTAGPEDIECFLIDAVTGSLSLRRSLLYDPCRSDIYQITVTATDQGLNPLSNSITITVDVDRNANPPIFQNIPTIISINENQLAGQSLFTVTATDADTVSPFNDIRYSLVGDGTATVYFQVDQSTGLVTLRQTVQADKASTYRLWLLAEDGGSPKKFAFESLDITVNRNLAAPKFNPATFGKTILENFPVGSEIITVTATDSDSRAPNNQFKFSLKGDAPVDDYFFINPDSGQISLKRTVRGSGFDQFIIQIIATDQGTPPLQGQATLTVQIQFSPYSNDSCEFNIYPPIFTAPLYFVNILEGNYTKNNQFLVQILASDEDRGRNGEIVFDIQSVSNNGAEKFNLVLTEQDEKIAVVCISSISRGETYVIMLRATDRAFPIYRRRSSSVPIEVKVGPFLVH